MLLDDAESGGLVYVNKDTYDQALLLSGRMDGNPQRVLDVIKTPKTEIYRTMAGFKALMENMMRTMPKPLNMLAPFLIFCVGNQGIEWKENDRILAYGILHQLSQLMDFNSATLVPAQIRTDVALPTALLMQYETSWNELCSSLEDKIVSITPEKSEEKEDAVTAEELRNTLEKITAALTRIEEMRSQAPQVIYAQQPMAQQPVVVPQPVVQPQPAVQIQPAQAQTEVTGTPVVQKTEETKAAETAGETKTTEPVKEGAPAPVQASVEEDEDAKKEAAVAAIIAKMNAEREAKNDKAKEKLDKLTEGSSSKTEDTTGSYHTDKRYTEKEREDINQVLDEYDF